LLQIYNTVGDDTPSFLDLYGKIFPQYATYWETIGAALGLDQHYLDIISQDNAYNPRRTQDCCYAMLKKWMKSSPSPTLRKFEDAISSTMEALTIAPSEDNPGKLQ